MAINNGEGEGGGVCRPIMVSHIRVLLSSLNSQLGHLMRALVKLLITSKPTLEDPQAVPRHMTDSNAKLKMQQHHTSIINSPNSKVYSKFSI